MTFHQLQIFAAVAKHLNVTNASLELHISQPSVSQQLKLLEEEFRAKLYRKMGRGIELTEEGCIFFRRAQTILEHVEKFKERFGRSPKDSPLAVGGSYQSSVALLPLAMGAFNETHPHVELIFRTGRSRKIEQLLLNSVVEIAVITTPSYFPSLVYETYGRAEMVLFVSPHHLLGKKTKWAPKDLDGASLVSKQGQRTEEFSEHLRKQGMRFKRLMSCESVEAVKAMVKRGMGIGSLYRDHVESEARTGVLKIIEGPQFRMANDRFIIYHKEKSLSQNAQEFLTLLREGPSCVKGRKGPRAFSATPPRLFTSDKKNFGQF